MKTKKQGACLSGRCPALVLPSVLLLPYLLCECLHRIRSRRRNQPPGQRPGIGLRHNRRFQFFRHRPQLSQQSQDTLPLSFQIARGSSLDPSPGSALCPSSLNSNRSNAHLRFLPFFRLLDLRNYRVQFHNPRILHHHRRILPACLFMGIRQRVLRSRAEDGRRYRNGK